MTPFYLLALSPGPRKDEKYDLEARRSSGTLLFCSFNDIYQEQGIVGNRKIWKTLWWHLYCS